MPLIESAPDALSRVYAQSLFELASEGGGQARIEEIEAELEAVVDIARDNVSFSEFLSSRILAASSRGEVIRRIFKGRVSDLTLNFLLVLNDKERLGHLASIAAAYDECVQKAFGRVEVDVYTAAPLDAAELTTIRERLRAVLGKEPVIHPYTDRSMIGGLRLQIGDQLIDASIATRLRQMREKLATGGSGDLRARFSRIIDESANGTVR